MSIGEVLNRLRPDFPDVSISKIRFLESEGLVEPERTPSGYRKFSLADLERLRYILTQQRDRYYPLKVIKEHLDAMERGLEPPTAAGEAARAPRVIQAVPDESDVAGVRHRLRSPTCGCRPAELMASSGLSQDQLDELVSFGIVSPKPGTKFFDADALAVCQAAAQLAEFGLEPRHIRAFKTAADREVGLDRADRQPAGERSR